MEVRRKEMLSRALNTKPRKRKSLRHGGEEDSFRSASISEYEELFIGMMEDMPLISTCKGDDQDIEEGRRGPRWTLREVLRGSVGVVGESRLGITEKVVLLEGCRVFGLKRFRSVSVSRREFGRRIERVAWISRQCQYLVPVNAYLYAKRIKFVLFDYFPMGSLADLLAGAREFGHTALIWKQRFKIILHIARAIAFIHSQSPPTDTTLQINIHGNLKPSNILIDTDFSAHISDYGFTQFAKRLEISDTGQSPNRQLQRCTESLYSETLSQKGDIYNFGIIVMDMLGGPKALKMSKRMIYEKREEIKSGVCEFFEFSVVGREERVQALKVLEMALSCTNRSQDSRPSIDQILFYLVDLSTK